MATTKSAPKSEADATFTESELSPAMQTLKPGAGTGGGDLGATKSQAMAAVMAAMGGMSKDDINKFADSLSQFGPNAALNSAGDAVKNAASIKMKPSAAIKEDVAELFAEDELSEEFREKAATLFEAAVNARVSIEEARLQEEFEELLDEALYAEEQALVEQVDQYLDYAVEQWFEANAIAIENSLRTDITEGFIDGLRTLFAENFMELPNDRLDIVEDLATQVDELTAILDETLSEKIKLERLVNEATIDATFDEVCEGLAETQTEKLRTLTEGLEFDSIEEYRKKVEIIKENYFTGKKATQTGFLYEESVSDPRALTEDAQPGYAPLDNQMNTYLKAIDRSVKK